MNKIAPILNIAGRVLTGLALASVAGMNLLMGYIMFAPDDLPKPFYLTYGGRIVPTATATQPMPAEGGEALADGTPAIEVPSHPGEGLMIETGTKIVNLADPGGRRYLKATIVIEVAPPAEVLLAEAEAEAQAAEAGDHGEGEAGAENAALTAFNDEISKRMPMINDTLTTLLSSKSFESVYTVEGKEALREEILEQLSERMPDLHVIAVYFTEFVVQ